LKSLERVWLVPGARQWNEGGHAIVRAGFGLEFASPPSARTIRELLALHPKLKDDYPRKQETKGRSIGFPAEALEAEDFRPEISELMLGGFTFDSLRADGIVLRSVALENNSLRVSLAEYETWDTAWARARKVFALMLPLIMEQSGVTAIHLQYLDRFIWEGDSDAFRNDLIFRRDSQFLAPHVFQVPDLWHSYHGYFEYPDQPQRHQLLNVVEARLITAQQAELPPEMGQVADISLNHRVSPGVERAGARVEALNSLDDLLGKEADSGALDAYMNEMHDKNKWLLASLINDELCDKISLPRPE